MSILVISPHMDDETFGAGGTIIKYSKRGEKVYWLNISNTKEDYGYSAELVGMRNKQFEDVAKKLGVHEAIDWKLCPAKLAEYSESKQIGKLAELVEVIKPEMILSPYYGDIHSDHGIVYSWVKAVSKSFRNPHLKKLLLMEIVSETDFAMQHNAFAPNYYIDITDEMEEKLSAVRIYHQEIREHPFPRSIDNVKAMAMSRGSVAGVKYAEAFVLMKGIEK